MGWGDAKKKLATHLETILVPMREQYVTLMDNPERIEDILQAGADKARKLAVPFMQQIREAVGLRNGTRVKSAAPVKKKSGKTARFISFRDEDGAFRSRLVSADGDTLLLSGAYAEPKQAGQFASQLLSLDLRALIHRNPDYSVTVVLDEQALGSSPAMHSDMEREALIVRLLQAVESLAPEREA